MGICFRVRLMVIVTMVLCGVHTVCGYAQVQTKLFDNAFLQDVEKHAFQYFMVASNPENGLVQDRAHNIKDVNWETEKKYHVASIAASGFYLSALIVGAENNWITRDEAQIRARNAVRFFDETLPNVEGFYYHFIDIKTGERIWNSELSSIDTSLFLAGALSVKEYFSDDPEIVRHVTSIYERVNWKWMMNDTPYLCMGWKPTKKGGKFLEQYWDHYCEGILAYILAIGSPTHPIPREAWFAIRRPVKKYGLHVAVACAPLFTHQYPQVWIDLRNKHDGIMNYFQNSVSASLANREFCIDNQRKYKTYGSNVWGLTACDGPSGYQAYGAKPGGAHHDGTIAPTAVAGSLVFIPEYAEAALKAMYAKHKSRLWGRFGFSDAFNIDRNWFGKECIAIDQGTMLLMIENARTELVWSYMMRNEWVTQALKTIGFKQGSKTLVVPQPKTITIRRHRTQITLDGDVSEWKGVTPIPFSELRRDYGRVSGDADFSGALYLAWRKQYLYIGLSVVDNELVCQNAASNIFKDDCLEIYVDPKKDGLLWYNKADVQVGISPETVTGRNRIQGWSWFDGVDIAKKRQVQGKWQKTENGYVLEAAIRIAALGISPSRHVRMSFSIHDKDVQDKSEAKLTTFFEEVNGKDGKIALGTVKFV